MSPPANNIYAWPQVVLSTQELCIYHCIFSAWQLLSNLSFCSESYKYYLTCHCFQILHLGMTTNERFNAHRYKHFHVRPGRGVSSPFNRGLRNNFVSFFCNTAPHKNTKSISCCEKKDKFIVWLLYWLKTLIDMI